MKILKNVLQHNSLRILVHCSITFSLCIILFSAWPVLGATYYVKAGGNDNLDGLSDATAWATIGKVTATVKSGDTVYFRSQDTWSVSSSLSCKAGVTYDGSSYGTGTRAKLMAANYYPDLYEVVAIFGSNVTFRGFEIDGNAQFSVTGMAIGRAAPASISNIRVDNCLVHNIGTNTGNASEWCRGIYIGPGYQNGVQVSVSNVTITSTTVYDTLGGGFVVYPTSYDGVKTVDTVLIRNCTAYNTGRNATLKGRGYGVDIKNGSDNVTVEYCNLRDNGNVGVWIETVADTSIGVPNNFVIRYNVISDNNSHGFFVQNAGRRSGITGSVYGNIFVNNGRNGSYCGSDIRIPHSYQFGDSIFNIYNNTIYSTANTSYYKYAVVIGANDVGLADSPTINFKNNIIYTGDYPAIVDKGNKLNHSNNLIYRASGDAAEHVNNGTSYNRAGVLTWEPSARNTDPLFVSTGTNFSLQAGSPAIDAGVSVGLPRDIVGNPVPVGAAPDIGAVEYQPYPASTTTPTVTGTTTTMPTTTVTGTTTTTTTPTTTATGTTTTSTTPTTIKRIKRKVFNR